MPPVTQLREYYDALLALKEEEQTALAEFHVKDPQFLLAHRFRKSVEALESRPVINEPFYPPSRTDPLSPLTTIGGIKRTIHFAAQLWDRRPRTVDGAESLAFRYVDRELFPLRTTTQDRVDPRRLDLLLANGHDGTPVFAELKIRNDKPAYFALVQVLMFAAELLVSPQRGRLTSHPPAADVVALPEQGPFADVYIIAFESPAAGDNRKRALEATERIAERLVQDEVFSRYVRRVAYVDAFADDDSLVFKKRFAFGPGV
jgi:hypothetical protein